VKKTDTLVLASSGDIGAQLLEGTFAKFTCALNVFSQEERGIDAECKIGDKV
jgi:hypothetical protein